MASALLKLELTQGVNVARPIAIVPFSGESALPKDAAISSLISQDMQNSGVFRLIGREQFPQQVHDVLAVKVKPWQAIGTEYVLVGTVKALPHEQYQVTVSLLNVFLSQGHAQANANNVVFSRVYVVQKANLQALAHQISDAIYQAATGVQGIFSTQLAYLLVADAGTSHPKFSLMVADYDGANPRTLVQSDQPMMSPAWSPDGKQIAFVSFKATFPAIYLVDVATGKLTQVTKLAGINGAPAWSLDGRSLAYVSTKTGVPKIYMRNLATGQDQQITHGPALDTEPQFSPDGKRLIFTSSRGGSAQIYTYTFATHHVERLTFSGDYNAHGSFSPDGRTIVMLHRENRQYFIALQALEDDNLTLLTQAGSMESPSFAPNGEMIVYAQGQGIKGGLAIISKDRRVQIHLPESNGIAREPDWSPFI